MKVELIESIGLPDGVPIAQYETVAEIRKDAGSGKLPPGVTAEQQAEKVIVDITNKYSRQKDGLVDFRDWLWRTIKARTQWKGYETKQEKAGDKTITVEVHPELKNIQAFVSAIVGGTFTHKDFPVKDLEKGAAEVAVMKVLQNWTNAGSKTQDVVNDKGEITGEEPLKNGKLSRWTNNIAVSYKESKAKTPPDYAIANAESVFSDVDKTGKPKAKNLTARLDGWFKTFTDKGITFDDFRSSTFDVKDPGAVAAAKTRLAWAIKADSDYEREQRELANPYK